MFGWSRETRRMHRAASWHARMTEPRSAAEVAAFEDWLAADPLNAQAYAEIEVVNAAVGTVPRPREAADHVSSPVFRPALAFVLGALAVLGVVALWQGGSQPAFATIRNDGSAIHGVRLDDGTRVWLDVGAEIGVRISRASRAIEVRKGRVRVVPARDPRPLAIRSEAVSVAPGSTCTDVAIASDRITVGGLDGPIDVEIKRSGSRSAPLQLGAGKALAIEARTVRPIPIENDWTAGRLRFSRARLSEVLALANRLGDPDIRAVEAGVAQLRVSGVFDLRDTRRLARKLAAALDLRVEEGKEGLILKR